MKQRYPAFALLAVLSLAGPALAQNYRPFRPGLTYQCNEAAAPGDTTHALRLVAARRVGADSVFDFNQRVGRRPAGTCPGRYVSRPDNLFGATLTVRAGTEYVLTAANANTFVLRPHQPIGQPWAAAAGLTASVTSRTRGLVLGRPDSLATIRLSDGQTVVLSKTYGWVSGPALGAYLSARLPRKMLMLTALPEWRLGAASIGPLAIFDFQPGDVFLRRRDVIGALGPCSAEQRVWIRDSVLSRVVSRTADTVSYQIRSQTLTQTLCGNKVLGAPTVQTLAVHAAYQPYGGVDSRTAFWQVPTASSRMGVLHFPAWRTSAYFNRPVQQHANYMACAGPAPADTTNLFDAGNLDAGRYLTTAAGLGMVRLYLPSFTTEDTRLIGYRKGAESWGQLSTFAQLLPTARAKAAATTSASPNPFGTGVTVSFALARAQPVGVELRDALGRVALRQPPAQLAAGAQAVSLLTVGLPGGFYTVHLALPAENRVEVLKVLKAE